MIHNNTLALEARVSALEAQVATLKRKRYATPSTLIAVYTIAREVAQGYRIPESVILGRNRSPAVVEARQLVMYRAHKAGFSSVQIGAALERDHATVLNGIKATKARRGE